MSGVVKEAVTQSWVNKQTIAILFNSFVKVAWHTHGPSIAQADIVGKERAPQDI